MIMLEYEGLDELIAEIEKLENAGETIKDEALIAGADVVKEQMKSEVYAHGLVRRSGDAEEAIDRTNPKNDEIFIGTKGGAKQPGFYLYMHEFGFYNVRARRFIAPKPFASIAFENAKSKVLDEQVKVLRKELGM
jgi:HK97 gp10 family phage protein